MAQADYPARTRGSYLESLRGVLWKGDLKALVGGVLLGVLLTVLAQIFERIDAALTGGAFVITGGINFFTISSVSTLLFRLPGGFITGEVNALIAVATGTSPMAPWFIPTNGLYPIVYGLIIWKLRMNKWWHHLLACGVGSWIANLVILVGLLVTIKLPLPVALLSYAVVSFASMIGAAILSPIIARAVDRSGVLQ